MNNSGICVCISKRQMGFKFGGKYRYVYDRSIDNYSIYEDILGLKLLMFSGEFKRKFKKLEDLREEKIQKLLE